MDKFQINKQATSQDADLTRSPQMNTVIVEATKILDGAGDVQLLHDNLADLELQVQQLIAAFNYESKFQEITDFFKQEAEIISENFTRLQEGTKLIRRYLEAADKQALEEGVGIAIESYDELFASFDRLKKADEERPIWSDSPFINEICRVADCVKRGTLPKERLQERIEIFLQIQYKFMADFDNMQPTIDERPIYEEKKDTVKEHLNMVLEGLNIALSYMNTGNEEDLDAGLEQAKEAVKFLIAFEKELKEAREAPKVKFCFKCGTENPRSARYCVKCNFNFPRLQMEEESTLDVRIEEGGIQQTGQAQSENVMKLYNVVDQIKTNQISMDEYLDTVYWFEDLLIKGREEQSKIKVPDDMGDPQIMEAFEQFTELFELGMTDLEQGIRMLKHFPELNDPNLLDKGMESILRGGDRMQQVQATSNQMQQVAMEQQ